MASPDLSVVIVNYNTFQLTCKCIESVYAKTKRFAIEVIVVDNNSTECNADNFLDLFPEIKLIKSTKNLGFSGGNNLGLKKVQGNYIVLLNSDTELKNTAIDITLEFLGSHPEVGVVSSSLLYPDGRRQSVCQHFPSVKFSLIELFRIHKLFSAKKRGEIMLGSFFDHASDVTPDWVWGTFFMFPVKVLKQLPGEQLDDTFFMYGEDMQWCFDIARLGYRMHYCADAEVIHHMGASSGEKEKWMKENYEIFLKKNYSTLHRKILKFVQWLLA
jgi:GT2 family glycosyltransferase